MWDKIKLVPDHEIWDLKCEERSKLINHIKERLASASTRMEGFLKRFGLRE